MGFLYFVDLKIKLESYFELSEYQNTYFIYLGH